MSSTSVDKFKGAALALVLPALASVGACASIPDASSQVGANVQPSEVRLKGFEFVCSLNQFETVVVRNETDTYSIRFPHEKDKEYAYIHGRVKVPGGYAQFDTTYYGRGYNIVSARSVNHVQVPFHVDVSNSSIKREGLADKLAANARAPLEEAKAAVFGPHIVAQFDASWQPCLGRVPVPNGTNFQNYDVTPN